MHIQCTKALLDYLKPQITERNTDSDMYAWHAHIVKRSRKNCFVLMHDLSRFVFCILSREEKRSQRSF